MLASEKKTTVKIKCLIKKKKDFLSIYRLLNVYNNKSKKKKHHFGKQIICTCKKSFKTIFCALIHETNASLSSSLLSRFYASQETEKKNKAFWLSGRQVYFSCRFDNYCVQYQSRLSKLWCSSPMPLFFFFFFRTKKKKKLH